MPWCEKCDIEYRDGFTVCADCGSELTERNLELEFLEDTEIPWCVKCGCENSDGSTVCPGYGSDITKENQYSEPETGRDIGSINKPKFIVITVLALLAIAWICSDFITWKRASIPVPAKSISVIYMARWMKSPFDKCYRKVLINTNHIHDKSIWIPLTGTHFPTNVYWYSEKHGKGPYLRFQDLHHEYLLDFKKGKVLFLVRLYNRGTYAAGGIPLGHNDSFSYSYIDGGNQAINLTVNGYPAYKVDDYIASNDGKYIGKIDSAYRFLSSKKALEYKFPKGYK